MIWVIIARVLLVAIFLGFLGLVYGVGTLVIAARAAACVHDYRGFCVVRLEQ